MILNTRELELIESLVEAEISFIMDEIKYSPESMMDYQDDLVSLNNILEFVEESIDDFENSDEEFEDKSEEEYFEDETENQSVDPETIKFYAYYIL